MNYEQFHRICLTVCWVLGVGWGLGWGLMVVGMGIDVGGDGDGVPITFDDNE